MILQLYNNYTTIIQQLYNNYTTIIQLTNLQITLLKLFAKIVC